LTLQQGRFLTVTMSEPTSTHMTIWVVSDGRRGIENQALGLAESVTRQLDRRVDIERVTVRKDGFVTLPAHSHPDLWIGCGRAAINLARRHRRIFPDCFFAYVQDPRTRHSDFDLIIAPRHDRLEAPNAIAMIGSPNRVTRDGLDQNLNAFAAPVEALSKPRAAILIGGDSKRFKLDAAAADYLEARLEQLLQAGISLMLTVSRRTPGPIRERFGARFSGRDQVWYFNGEGDNPYFAFLAAADWIFVTEESTNMLVEAGATGKPVYVLPMTGTPGKFAALHADLEAAGVMRPYLGQLDNWSYPRLNETDRVARELITRLQRQRNAHQNEVA